MTAYITAATGRAERAAHIPHPTKEDTALCDIEPASSYRPLSREQRRERGLDICGNCLKYGPVEGVNRIGPGTVRTLTDRQRAALRLAVAEGYYEWPRKRSSTELAAEMGIAQPTFSRLLRVAEKQVFEELFDAESLRTEHGRLEAGG